MTIPTEVLDFYKGIVACPCTADQCPNTVKDIASGQPPRGFFACADPNQVKVMLVGKNPGHPMEIEKKEYYRGRDGIDLVRTHMEFVRTLFTLDEPCANPKLEAELASDRRSQIFHRNILRYLDYILDDSGAPLESFKRFRMTKETFERVFKTCVFSNLVKCSNVIRIGRDTGERDRLRFETIKNCCERHFLRELSFWKPKALIAFGNEVSSALGRIGMGGVPVITIKHPSYFYRRASIEHDSRVEADYLQAIKNEVQQHLLMSSG